MSKVRYINGYQSHTLMLNSTNTQKSNPDDIFGIRLRTHYSAGKISLMASNSPASHSVIIESDEFPSGYK